MCEKNKLFGWIYFFAKLSSYPYISLGMMGTAAVSNPKVLARGSNGDCIYETVCGGVVCWVERRVNVPIPWGSHVSGSFVKN